MFGGSSWQIAKIGGIPVRLHVSWFIIFGLITWSLATQYFPVVAPELPKATNWLRAVVAALLLFLSVTAHELSHSFVARRYKIPIASITLFIFGGVSQIKKEPPSPKVEFNMAIAGPLSSFLIALIFFLLLKASDGYPGLKAIAFYLMQVNLILGIFNLIPGFPMDGGRVLRAALWKKSGDYISATRKASKTGQAIAVVFMFFGIFSLFTGYHGSLWLLLIGWFLYTAAQSSYQQATLRETLNEVKVRDVMTKEIVTVNEYTPLSELFEGYFLKYGYGGFPVVADEKAVGMISLREIRGIPKERWNYVKAKDVMQPFDESLTASGNEDVYKIFERMIQEDRGRFLVMEGGRLAGLITRSGIARYLQIKEEVKG
ncbi:MAG: site-2 protease family protein [Nitrospirae bacterium]|nr:site-2 protease family protein [Nitrospirota bacterium]